jgi:hypothetical protein
MTEEMKRNDATRYFIIMFGDKYELQQTPFENEADARKAIDDLALTNPRVKFGLYQKAGTAIADLAITWKGHAA